MKTIIGAKQTEIAMYASLVMHGIKNNGEIGDNGEISLILETIEQKLFDIRFLDWLTFKVDPWASHFNQIWKP